MTRFWNDLEGVSFAGRYRLERCLAASEGDAWYQTRLPGGPPAAMRVAADSSARLALWREAVSIEHPNLVRMLDAGFIEIDGAPFIYAVCEFPDDFLAGVLQERPLSPVEAGEVLRVALHALRFLHARGLAHGAVDPSHIMAFGETVKLPSDTWERLGSGGERRTGPYHPPEAAGGVITPAGDVWALAITLHEMLTQQRPNLEHDSDFRYMAEPFANILRHSLLVDPEARWTADDILRHLDPESAAPAPAAASPQHPAARSALAQLPAAGPAPPPAPLRPFSIRWVPVAGVVAASLLGIYFLRKPEEPARPAPPAARPAASVPAKADSGRPSPMPPAAASAARWRVIAYTYNTRPVAQKKLDSIALSRPAFEPQIFAPAGERGPFFVSLGGWMARAQAEDVRKRARAQGLPRDTFIRNFSR